MKLGVKKLETWLYHKMRHVFRYLELRLAHEYDKQTDGRTERQTERPFSNSAL